ncbi:acyltransferase [Paraburkholderia sp. Cpub6]|uniref:acyltransferase family protein n=1 Tax=Paraburkholderia sp. Cpub6 TaxID=2723094 RepID=UPI00160AE959|nr:acyltransferase [Paraburkholderia sp. Cpub6]MBB5462863.1 peptidoglycan/LPS O-acetylase OafA/YrhL [Paraburkholderia sp. Cpub6]
MRHDNNFDFLRVAAALAVLISHVRPLHDNTFPLGDLGAVGVFAFFSMSGYLVSASWERDPHAGRFLSRRALRIFPGLAAAIAFAAFVVGPLVTNLSFGDYIRSPLLLQYCRSILLYPMSFSLPGVFADNPFRDNVNGSLWTLPMEVFLYGSVMAISLTLRSSQARIAALASLLALCYGLEIRQASGIVLTMPTQELYRCASSFIVGALLWQLRDDFRLPDWSWMPIVVFLLAVHATAVEVWSLILLVPLATVSFANASYGFIRRAGRFGDVSYGLYVYAFLIQQTLMHYFPSIGVNRFFVWSAALSAMAGFASWHLIEKRAIKLKGTLSRRVSSAAAATS